MASDRLPAPNLTTHPVKEDSPAGRQIRRRSFLKGIGVAGAAVSAGGLLTTELFGAEERSGSLTAGDAAILRFLAAAEIIESDLWLQYTELAGTQDNEVPTLASQLIPGYPNTVTGGSPLYTLALTQLDGDMPQYIHDNTEDELTHEDFINAYLASKGADTVSLDQFRTLPSSKATGAQQIGRLTNLMQLTLDTSWWTRYRSRTGNPDFGDKFPNAIPSLAVGQHTAIPRTDDDVKPDPSKPMNISDFTQAIANTAGFHFAFIEQGGSSLYPQLAQRVTSPEVLRILLSIGGTEITHFQTWHDKAGNSPRLVNVVDPVTKVKVTFPGADHMLGEDLQTNLIMPEPTKFLSKNFPVVSIIRPTATKGAAMAALKSFNDDGLFIGQTQAFFDYLRDLAEDADDARREH
jgi:TAT (twin-arginine translocation) pathway signal sequence